MAKKYLIDGERFLVSASIEFHSDLLKNHDKSNVKGGGWWHRDEENKFILLYDTSIDFGSPTKEDIIEAIRKYDYITFFKNMLQIRFSKCSSLENAMKDYEVIFKFIYNNKNFYDGKNDERTRKRLEEISDLGLIEVSYGEFGIKDLMSGLYIEMIWSYNDEDWESYILWIKEIKNRK